jgi:hypothetical protein
MVLGVHGITSTPVEFSNSERVVRSNASVQEPSFKEVLARNGVGAAGQSPTQHVAPTRTPLSGSQASAAIRSAYVEVMGQEPSEGTLAILTSHWALETGQGKSMYNYNFAGIKGRGPEGFSVVMKTREGYGDHAVQIRDGFRAYTSAEAGAKDYVSLLQRRYGSALEAAANEDPGRFASELKARGYYTGDPELYSKSVTQLANRAMAHGFDAIGTTAGALTLSPRPQSPYFSTPPSGFAGAAPYQPELAPLLLNGPRLSMDGVFEPNAASVDALRDEMSRAALLIAARRGAV